MKKSYNQLSYYKQALQKSLRFLLIGLFFLSFHNFLTGEVVTIEKARTVAINHFHYNLLSDNPTLTKSDIQITAETIYPDALNPAYYVFNLNYGADKKGFTIVSAEDLMDPVLAESYEQHYSTENQPPQLAGLMQMYEDMILYCRETGNKSSQATEKWETFSNPSFAAIPKDKGVGPLLTTNWNQDHPYNYYAPSDPSGPGGHAYAGCVATAMSMVINYHEFPLKGRNQKTYVANNGSQGYGNYGSLTARFDTTHYDYNDMPNQMWNVTATNYIVPLLMYQCGVGVSMMYGPNGSGAYSSSVPAALMIYFRYESANYVQKDSYTAQTWQIIIKNELDNNRVVYYGGQDASGGHAFVCDGYNDSDLFHFNFGWSGYLNGYYSLANPGGFSNNQSAVINVMPPPLSMTSSPAPESQPQLIAYTGETLTYIVNSNVEWTISSTAGWISLDQYTGLYDDTLTVTISENTTDLGRDGSFTISAPGVDDIVYEFTQPSEISINDINSDIALSIYPNPAEDYLRVNAISNIQEISVLNILGDVIHQAQPKTKNTVLDVRNYQPGVYFIQIHTDHGTFTKRMQKL